MKSIKVKTFCAGALGLVMLASCSDWLDPKPLSFFTPENTFDTYAGLKSATDMLNRDVRYFDFTRLQVRPNLVFFLNIGFRKWQ